MASRTKKARPAKKGRAVQAPTLTAQDPWRGPRATRKSLTSSALTERCIAVRTAGRRGAQPDERCRARRLRIDRVPETYFLDGRGQIVSHRIGEINARPTRVRDQSVILPHEEHHQSHPYGAGERADEESPSNGVALTPGGHGASTRSHRREPAGVLRLPTIQSVHDLSSSEGQAKYLIVRRGYGSQQIADIWDLEDGCGGQ